MLERNHIEELMRRALALAERGGGKTMPNPMVGCVLVNPEGRVLGEGYHAQAGGPHAEVAALEASRVAANDVRGAIAIVSLEPCAAHGRTAACTDALSSAGISSVFYGTRDPATGAGGERALEAAGIAVTGGILLAEAERLNEAWLHFVRTSRPFFHIKTAQTLNGRVTRGREGDRWITGKAAQTEVHRLRRLTPAVMVGAGTVLDDDPLLTVRKWPPPGNTNRDIEWPEVQPIRIVLDSGLRTPRDSNLVRSAAAQPVWIFCSQSADATRRKALIDRGVDVIPIVGSDEGVDLQAVSDTLAARGVAGVLVEPGPTLATSFVAAGLVDRWTMFLAPDWVTAKGALPLLLSDRPRNGFRLDKPEWQSHGRDAAVTGLVETVSDG
ncbi:MAG: bifunctional diaminohydroxyphosphoribosylaminopyrimidine deaminase/5-amino-6-(5-phosphoribosylamino)uracil reductase RibD [Gemmatimonadetes bacterium]|nr:bifunctional diaminohydroxyphosphoribosylaminopyrimidine deaminase/5-amino-6-(5-phosphoribosylamino)uracil reductase RibD [Gemmatimonadota bacterium]